MIGTHARNVSKLQAYCTARKCGVIVVLHCGEVLFEIVRWNEVERVHKELTQVFMAPVSFVPWRWAASRASYIPRATPSSPPFASLLTLDTDIQSCPVRLVTHPPSLTSWPSITCCLPTHLDYFCPVSVVHSSLSSVGVFFFYSYFKLIMNSVWIYTHHIGSVFFMLRMFNVVYCILICIPIK